MDFTGQNFTDIAPEKFLVALTSAFGGKDTHDSNGKPLESKTTKSWTFTLYNSDRKTHLTFRSRRPKGWTINSPVLIDLMVGTDNESEFQFIGSVNHNIYKGSNKAKVIPEKLNKANKTMNWLLTRITNKVVLPEALEIKGSTKCARCSRKLTNPDSIDDGLGPICRSKMNQSKVSK